MRIAVGDVHGEVGKLERLVSKCFQYAGAKPFQFIFLGDYIDRGPDSRGVIDTIIALEQASPNTVIALAGNHEELLLDSLKSETAFTHWLANGGGATLRSYGVSAVLDIPEEHLRWLAQLHSYYDDGHRLFVHAGIRPGVPIKDQHRRDLLWIRERFLSSSESHGRLVVHGHSPTGNRKPQLLPNRLNLDTGAVFGGPLTAAVFNETQVGPIEILQA